MLLRRAIIATQKWVALLAILNITNLFYTQNPYYGKAYVILNLACLLAFWVTRGEITSHGKRKALLWVITGSGVLVSIECFVQFYTHKGLILWWSSGEHAIGTIGNSNYLGAYLLIPLFASLALPRFGYGAFFVILWALFVCRARASWLGFGFGFFLWLYCRLPKRIFAGAVAFGILAGTVGLVYFPNAANRWGDPSHLKYRVKYWQASIELWKESPIFGTGLASFRNRVYDAQARLGAKDPKYWDGYVDPKPRRAHNDYLESLNDGGILYAFVFWGFILYVLYGAYKRGLDHKDMAIFCGEIAVLVSAIFFFPFKIYDTSILFFVHLGVLCSSELRQGSSS